MTLTQRPPETRQRGFLLTALFLAFVALQFGLKQAGVAAASERLHFAIPALWLAWTLLDPVRRSHIKRPQAFAWLMAIIALGVLLRVMDIYASDYPAWTESASESLLRVWFALSLCAIFGRLHAGFGWLLQNLAKKSESRRVVCSIMAALLALLVFFPYQFTFWSVHRPHHANLANPRQAYGLGFENVTFPAADDDLQLRGWFVPASKPTNATVVVCHGIGANQSVFSGVLPFLHRAGFNVLTFDFRGHGNSNGHTTSFGFYEARDVRGAVAYLKTRGQTRVALYGFSMGGAAVLLATTQLPDLRAVVVDSTFADFGPLLQAQTGSSSFLGSALPTLASVFGHLELGFDAGEIVPRRAVAKLSPRPILIIHGLADRLIPVEQARENFAAARQPKQLLLIPKAGHCRGRLVNPGQYEPRVAAFLRAAFADKAKPAMTQSLIEPLLPRALDFVTREEARALRDGVPLTAHERELATRCGVAHPERVRLLRVAAMPQPDDAMLRAAQAQSGFSLADAGGLTLGHAVFIVERAWRDESLIAHELVHVAQYERLGRERFLREYLDQVLSVGYHQAPFEREAVETSRRVLSQS